MGEAVDATGGTGEQRSWLALRLVKGVGPVVYQGLLRAFATPAAVFAASAHALECAGVRPEIGRAIRRFDDWARVDDQVRRAERAGVRLLTWSDAAYPAALRQIHDPPPFLFVRGAITPGDALAVAVVGSRRASSYGLRMARELSEGLARCGVTVVSGLARGTDAQAHWAALRGGGRTIAVLGSGIDVVYPSEHKALSQKIAESGAVVTEMLMGTQPDAENFPARNRIISGMSLGTLVIEAAEKSGSLITARFALEHGREVFALPGTIGDATRGTHGLLRDGAKLTERVEDILEELAPQLVHRARRPTPPELTPRELRLRRWVGPTPVHIDDLIETSAMPTAEALETLLSLELKGVVEQLPGKYFVASGVDDRRSRAKEG